MNTNLDNLIGKEFAISKLICKLAEIDNMRFGMYSHEDTYQFIPKLLFKFKLGTSQDIYDKIKKCVESFEGQLKWTMQHDGVDRRYRIIIPELYANKLCAQGKRQVGSQWDIKDIKFEAELYSEQIYNETCEKAIEDIPELAKHIENYFRLYENQELS